MPRYTYYCSACNETYQIFHLMDEEVNICEKCKASDSMERIPTFSHIKTSKQEDEMKRKVGDATVEYIEETRRMIEEQKKELKRKGMKIK